MTQKTGDPQYKKTKNNPVFYKYYKTCNICYLVIANFVS